MEVWLRFKYRSELCQVVLLLETVVSKPTDCIARRACEGSITMVVVLRMEDLDEFGDESARALSGVPCSGSSPASAVITGSNGGVLETGREVETDPELVDGELRLPVG